MTPNADIVALMTTEAGRLLIMIFFYFLAIKPIKKDVHAMAEKINLIFVRLAQADSTKQRVEDIRTDVEKLENRLHAVEIQQRGCPANRLQ